MKLKSRFTGSLILFLLSFSALAQQDSTRKSFSFDVSFDYGKLATLLMEGNQSKYEAEVGIMYHRFRISGEYGLANLNSTNLFDNSEIETEGSYFRIGLDFRLAINPKNNLYFGGRYASADFDESIMVTYNSSVFNPYFEENPGLSAQWYEGVITSETRLIAQLFMGFKVRLRFLNNYDNPGFIQVIEIPGYGKTYDKTAIAFNLFLRYRINFR